MVTPQAHNKSLAVKGLSAAERSKFLLQRTPQGERINFKNLELDDATLLSEYSSDSRFYRYFEFPKHESIKDTISYVKKLMDRQLPDEKGLRRAHYWLVTKNSGEVLGTVGLLNIDFSRNSSEWGFGINPEVWGDGTVFEMCNAVLEYCFQELDLNRVFGVTRIDNEPTQRVLEALGFKCEGCLRQYYLNFEGEYSDAFVYGILKHEFSDGDGVNPNPTTQATKSELLKILQDFFNDPCIDENSSYESVMGWDSMAQVELALRLEAEYGRKIYPAEMSLLCSFESIFEILVGK